MPDAVPAPLLTQEAAPLRKPGFRVAGISGVFDASNEAGVPLLWPRLDARLPLPGQIGGGTFGVACPTGEGEGVFRYMAAVEIAANAPVPDGVEAQDIPAQTYLVFHLRTDGSDLHPQVYAATREIWQRRVPQSGFKRANGPNLEVYPPDFAPRRPSKIEWWIPVEA